MKSKKTVTRKRTAKKTTTKRKQQPQGPSQHEQDRLDEALMGSFPASDPVQLTEPRRDDSEERRPPQYEEPAPGP